MNKQTAKTQHGLTLLGATQAGADEFFAWAKKDPKQLLKVVNAVCSARTSSAGIAASKVHLHAAEFTYRERAGSCAQTYPP